MKKCQTRNKRSLGLTLPRSYSPPLSAVVPIGKRVRDLVRRVRRFRLREMSFKVLIETDASSDGCDARKRPNTHRGTEPKDPGALYHRGRANARRVRRLRRPETTQRVSRNRAQSRKLPSAISGCPDLMTPNQHFLRIYNRFCQREKSDLPRKNGAY